MPPGLDWRAQCAVQDIIAWVRGNFQKLLSKGVGCTFLRTLSDYVFTGILFSVGPPGGAIVLFFVFTGRGARPTPSGGHIFLCVKKDMEERHAKGLQSRPLESGFYTGVRRGDVRASYVFAVMQLTRFRPVRGVLRTASTDSIVLLRLRRMRNTHRITNLICSRKLGGCESAINSTASQHAERMEAVRLCTPCAT